MAQQAPPCQADYSAAVHDEYYPQCAAYAEAIQDMYGREVDSAWVLRFDKKTGEFEVGSSKELNENFIAVLGFLEGYSRLKTLENRT